MGVESRLAKRTHLLSPSATLAITSKAKRLKAEGRDVVNLAAGEPDFDTPDFVKEAAVAAIKQGFTKYTPTTGTPELKQAACEKFRKDNGLDYSPAQIVVSCGAKHSIFNALFVLLGPGEEALIPSPYWVSYPEMVQLCGAVPRFIPAEAENNFKITAAQLRRHLSARSKVFILNSPSNPTGCVYTRAEISELAAVCAEKGIFIISDEIYEKIIFDGLRPFSPAALGKDVYELTVTVNGLSKSHSMTGWRIGYLGAHPAVAAAISSLQDHTTSNPTSIAQKAALAALQQQDGFTQQMCAEFEKRRDFACSRIAKMGKISCVRPQGAFYIFCDIAKTGLGSAVFANRLLEEESVALIPGEGFGRDDFARISFATSIEQLEKGLDRIERWLNNISATDDRGKNT